MADQATINSELWFLTQKDLPPLPVPPLAETMDRYLESVKMLLSDDEFAHTTQVVAEQGV
jgi:hypothetical protein